MEHLLYDVMVSCLNVPYVWGGNNPLGGLDCSGFALWCLHSIGLWTTGDTTAQGLYSHFKLTGTELDKEDELPIGTLIFFGADKDHITHVALAIDSEHMIEAGGGGSKCKTPTDAAKIGACVRIRPISSRRDLVSFVLPYPQQKS